MECKITKQDVMVEKVLLSRVLEQPADMEFSLPDYCPDIERVLKCCVKPVIGQKLINADSLLIDGVAYVNLLYCDQQKQLRSFEYPYPFSAKTDLSHSAADAVTKQVSVHPVIESLSCRALTDRRVQVKFSIGLKTKVTATFAKPILADIDTPRFEQLRSFAPSSSPVAVAEKYVLVTDTLSLSDDAPEIRCILRYDVRSTINETKAIGKKAVVKGDILLDVMYMSASSKECKCAKFSLPYAQILDVESLSEECTISVQSEIASSAIRPKTNINGEIRNLSVEIKVGLSLTAFCNLDVPIIEDAFSLVYDTALTHETVDFKKVEKSISDTVTITKTLDVPPENATSVVDVFSSVADVHSRCENGTFSLSGSLAVTVITSDESGDLYSFDRSADFEYSSSFEPLSDSYTAECSAVVVSSEAKVTSSGVEVKLTVSLLVDIIGTVSKQSATDIAFDEQPSKKESCLVAFNAKSGTKVWDIAKKYRSSCEDIRQINGIAGDQLAEDKMVIVAQ